MKTLMTRAELVKLCDDGIVAHGKWSYRDTHKAQKNLGSLRALLMAGCDFRLRVSKKSENDGCVSDKKTLWVDVKSRCFQDFEKGRLEWTWETFYCPTRRSLDKLAGKDWY